MTRRLVVRPEASAHIAEAFSWYQAQRDDLGWELKAELNAAFRLVQQAPEAGPVAYRGLRRMLLNRFPYAVYYTHAGAHRDSRAHAQSPASEALALARVNIRLVHGRPRSMRDVRASGSRRQAARPQGS